MHLAYVGLWSNWMMKGASGWQASRSATLLMTSTDALAPLMTLIRTYVLHSMYLLNDQKIDWILHHEIVISSLIMHCFIHHHASLHLSDSQCLPGLQTLLKEPQKKAKTAAARAEKSDKQLSAVKLALEQVESCIGHVRADQWACAACTLLNDPVRRKCAACGADRATSASNEIHLHYHLHLPAEKETLKARTNELEKELDQVRMEAQAARQAAVDATQELLAVQASANECECSLRQQLAAATSDIKELQACLADAQQQADSNLQRTVVAEKKSQALKELVCVYLHHPIMHG